jgi:hypothetical protein
MVASVESFSSDYVFQLLNDLEYQVSVQWVNMTLELASIQQSEL